MKHDFLDFLTSKGLLDHSVVERIKIETEESKVGVVALVSRLSTLSDTRLAREVAEFSNLPRFNYNRFDVDKAATELVSGIVSVRLGVLPYRFNENGDLYIVCCDPEPVEGLVRDLQKVVHGEVILEIGPIRAVRELAAFVHYGRGFSNDFESIVCAEDSDSIDEKKGLSRDQHSSDFSKRPSLHGSSPSKTFSEELSKVTKEKACPPPPPQSDEFGPHPIASVMETPSDLDELPRLDDPVDIIIDRQLAHLAELHEESLASEWEDEDTVVRQRNSRDESLRNFFLEHKHSQKQEKLDRLRRNLAGKEPKRDPFFAEPVEESLLDPISEGEVDLDVSDATTGSTGYNYQENQTHSSGYASYYNAFGPRSPDSETPCGDSSAESSVVLRLFQHEARIEQLEQDLEKATEKLWSLVSCLEECGIDLSKLKKLRDK